MKDRDIQTLLRMAGEAEDLEAGRSGHAPLHRIQSQPVSFLRVGGLSAAAAAVLLGGMALLHQTRPIPEPITGGPGMAQRPELPGPDLRIANSSTKPAEDDGQSCIVLTMFRDGDACSCVQVKEHDLPRRLEDVTRSELINLALATPCSTSAQKVVVLAVSGRSDALPKTREEAEAVAARLNEASKSSTGDVSSYAYAAFPALGPDGTIVTETLAWKKAATDPVAMAAALRQ
jgi:hypothetical protein